MGRVSDYLLSLQEKSESRTDNRLCNTSLVFEDNNDKKSFYEWVREEATYQLTHLIEKGF